jgi:Domain of unknown function (DUF1707)
MGRVGDPERDAAADALGSAYVRGYLTHQELSERLGEALSARSARELGASVRGLPGGGWFMFSASLRPFLSARSQTVRHRAGGILRRLALALFAATSAVLLLGFGLWTLADGLSARVALGFLLVWLALSGPPLLIWRSAGRLLR